ncbi:MAG: YitT family protein [Clostridium sp.]|nr:YitT family protein [Clostridium sp.]MCM1399206.1 YitT family protein [Clostridium sp.]MCM1459228.1 YitT family protein [Bacteroides sp.]
MGKLGKYYDTVMIVVGTFLMATAVVSFFDVMGVVVGGASGISIIVKAVLDVPMWVISALLNIPLFIAGFKRLEREMFYRTLFATFTLILFLGILPQFDILTGDMLADIIAGGTCMGIGLGLVFCSYASSGGTDLLATLINQRVRHISIPKVLAIVDAVIVVAGAGTFGVKKGIYSLIGIVVVTRMSDYMVEGPNRAKLLYVISDAETEIVDYIVNTLKRGATFIDVKGAFTNDQKQMIMCVLSGKEIVKVKQIIYKMDEKAICFVGDIREAFGEGFTKFRG